LRGLVGDPLLVGGLGPGPPGSPPKSGPDWCRFHTQLYRLQSYVRHRANNERCSYAIWVGPEYTALQLLQWVKPKFHYADFRQNFPARKVADTNHESRRRDLCRGFSWFVSATTCPGLCRKVGVMEFGLKRKRLDCLDYTVVCFVTHDCSSKLLTNTCKVPVQA